MAIPVMTYSLVRWLALGSHVVFSIVMLIDLVFLHKSLFIVV